MKKTLLGIVIGSTLAMGGAVLLSGKMLDDKTMIATIKDRQTAYFAEKGYYFQVPPTHSTIPEVDTPTVADFTKIPSGRAEPQTVDGKSVLQADVEGGFDYSTTVNTCERGKVRGYTIILEKKVAGVRNVLREGVGACAEASHPWREEQRLRDL